MIGIGNVGIAPLLYPWKLSYMTYLYDVNAIEINNFYDRLCSDMIAKSIEVSITKTFLKKLRLHHGVYEWADSGRIIINYGPNMIHLLFKSINPATSIYASNLKY